MFTIWSCASEVKNGLRYAAPLSQTLFGIPLSSLSPFNWKNIKIKCVQNLTGKIPLLSVCRQHDGILPEEHFTLSIYPQKLRQGEALLLPSVKLKLTQEQISQFWKFLIPVLLLFLDKIENQSYFFANKRRCYISIGKLGKTAWFKEDMHFGLISSFKPVH